MKRKILLYGFIIAIIAFLADCVVDAMNKPHGYVPAPPVFSTKAYKELYPDFQYWNETQAHNMFVAPVYGEVGKMYINTSGTSGDLSTGSWVYTFNFDGDNDKTFHMAMNKDEARNHLIALQKSLSIGSSGTGDMDEVSTVKGQSSSYTYYHRYDKSSNDEYVGICNSSEECTSFDKANALQLMKIVARIAK